MISKLLERLVTKQLTDYLRSADLLPSLQSGFRPGHSTETAALRVLSDILGAVDSGDVAALVLLDLSAAYDTVDHATLYRRSQVSYGLGGRAGMVPVLLARAVPVRSTWHTQVSQNVADMWRPTGVGAGPDPAYSLYC